jgi:hypothetical protein
MQRSTALVWLIPAFQLCALPAVVACCYYAVPDPGLQFGGT